jgi:uncharacterized protein YqeY
MAELRNQLNDAIKDAMRAKDKDRLSTLRMASAAIKQVEVDERIELDDTRILAILDKMIRQRRDSAEQYTAAGRPELASREQAEITVLESFLPAPLNAEELNELITRCIAITGAASIKDMGKVMAAIKPLAQGRADMAQIGAQIKARLS